jgi:2-polyprenyl-3-methyl-5-hydroxy-6-metoxy-1,4-benzoquinol methylase
MSTLEDLYHTHHEKGDRLGLSLFKDTRGDFLRNAVGTGKRVLDIGCRDGVLTETYAKGNEVVGVDIDSAALAAARERLGIETTQFDLNGEWPLPPASFDAVVAGEVLEHLYFPEKVIERITGVLTSDGVFAGSVPNAFSLRNRFRLFFAQKKNTPLGDPTHINHFSRPELIQMLSRHFKEVTVEPLGRYAALDKIFPGYFSFMHLFKAKGKKTG